MHSSLISYEPFDAYDFVKSKIRIYLYRGSNGQKPLNTDILETRGQKYLDGDSKRTMKAVFFWAPVFVCLFCLCFSLHLWIKKEIYISTYIIPYFFKIVAPGSNFSLCIVMEKDNIVSDIENLNHPISGDFVYHRWDLNRWPAPFCRHFSRYATQGLFIFFSIDWSLFLADMS